jgi:hypothetical protein
MYYSYVEIEYVAMSFSPARTDLALKLLTLSCPRREKKSLENPKKWRAMKFAAGGVRTR